MKYCVTREDIDWIIKDWPAQWKMPVEKPTTMSLAKQSTKSIGKDEAGPSTKTNSPNANTRKVVVRTQAIGSSTVPKRPRRIATVPMKYMQKDAKKGDTSQVDKEGEKKMTSGAQPP
jgi:hypothetical protein